jgi:DNA-binding NarL/FixJ family response regulator
MSGVSLPVTRPSGRVLLVSNAAARSQIAQTLSRLGYTHQDADDPYAAMAELCRDPQVYRAVILSIASVYREELTMIAAVKRRFPFAEVWLTHTDGRHAALAEAMRLGADGFLDEEGLHRVATPAAVGEHHAHGHGPDESARLLEHDFDPDHGSDRFMPGEVDEHESNEPILSPDELRALLHEQPSVPPTGEDEME